jgi:hypothetical protein
MSHFAKVIDGLVTEVIVAEQDVIDSGLFGDPSLWIQTSYNTYGNVHYGSDRQPDGGVALRGNYASIGSIYDAENDVFYGPQLFNGWILNRTTWLWEPPTPRPDSGRWRWDNATEQWVDNSPPLNEI